MAQLSVSQLSDLIVTTRAQYQKSITELATDIQEHHAFSRIFKKENVQVSSGTSIKRTILTNHSGAARHVGVFEQDQVNVKDVMTTLDVDWRRTTTNYAFDVTEEAINGGPEQIVDLVKVRRMDAFISLAAKIEENFWGVGPLTSSDKITPFGIGYYVVKPGASAGVTGTFTGYLPTGHTTVAGLTCSATSNPRWANYQANYTNITKADLVTKLRKAYVYTNFRSPIEGEASVPSGGRGGNRYAIYTNYDVVSGLESVGEDQNDNLGRDIASMDGKITFRGTPINWVPYLDSDTQDPLYLINWSLLVPYVFKGFYMRESKPEKSPLQHTVVVSHVDLMWNLFCSNRRGLAVLAK
jgi:hypothetical protein